MGNICCGGRPGKNPTLHSANTLDRASTKQYTASTTATRGRTKSFSRRQSAFGKKKSLTRKSTAQMTSKKQPEPLVPSIIDNLPVSPESKQQAEEIMSHQVEEKSPEPLLPLGEEDSIGECSLSLEYVLETAKDCSTSQQQQMLTLFESDESLDGLTSIRVYNGDLQNQTPTLALTSKHIWILSAFDYSAVKLKLSLQCIRLLCLPKDRTILVIVYKREEDVALKHLTLGCHQLEDLLRAIVSVAFDETTRLIPAVTQGSLDDVLQYVDNLKWPLLNELNSNSHAYFLKYFYTKGVIGENKVLFLQCRMSNDGVEKSVKLLVSDRAVYVIDYSQELLHRVPTETITAVRTTPTSLTVSAGRDYLFIVTARQAQSIEESVTRFRPRAQTL